MYTDNNMICLQCQKHGIYETINNTFFNICQYVCIISRTVVF